MIGQSVYKLADRHAFYTRLQSVIVGLLRGRGSHFLLCLVPYLHVAIDECCLLPTPWSCVCGHLLKTLPPQPAPVDGLMIQTNRNSFGLSPGSQVSASRSGRCDLSAVGCVRLFAVILLLLQLLRCFSFVVIILQLHGCYVLRCRSEVCIL